MVNYDDIKKQKTMQHDKNLKSTSPKPQWAPKVERQQYMTHNNNQSPSLSHSIGTSCSRPMGVKQDAQFTFKAQVTNYARPDDQQQHQHHL